MTCLPLLSAAQALTSLKEVPLLYVRETPNRGDKSIVQPRGGLRSPQGKGYQSPFSDDFGFDSWGYVGLTLTSGPLSSDPDAWC